MADKEPLFAPVIDGEYEMALLIVGKTICNLCGNTIEHQDLAFSFPAFCQNENDPCSNFSDGVFHSQCLSSSSHGKTAILRASDWHKNVGPGKRKCEVCGVEITDPGDYFFIPYISGADNSELMKFNYTHLHKSHISKWPLAGRFIELATSAIESGFWGGNYLQHLIEEMRTAG